MAGNGTTNYSFVASNALSNNLHTGTNSGMITNGMQSRSVGGKRRRVSKRMHGGAGTPAENLLVKLNEILADKSDKYTRKQKTNAEKLILLTQKQIDE